MIKDERRESEIQSSIVALLRGFGFTVLVTSRNLQRGGSAIQKGIPDLLVSIPNLPYAWIGLEVKTAKGKVRPEQQELHDQKKVAIVRNEHEACKAIAYTVGDLPCYSDSICINVTRWLAETNQ